MFSSVFILSSTNLYLDNVLYAIKTTNAIIKKSMILAIKSQYLNSEIAPETLVTFAESCSKLPDGKNKPINGLIISSTNAVINLEDAWTITNTIAKPIIPKVLRKSKNCEINVLVDTRSDGDDGVDEGKLSFVNLKLILYINE